MRSETKLLNVKSGKVKLLLCFKLGYGKSVWRAFFTNMLKIEDTNDVQNTQKKPLLCAVTFDKMVL